MNMRARSQRHIIALALATVVCGGCSKEAGNATGTTAPQAAPPKYAPPPSASTEGRHTSLLAEYRANPEKAHAKHQECQDMEETILLQVEKARDDTSINKAIGDLNAASSPECGAAQRVMFEEHERKTGQRGYYTRLREQEAQEHN